MPTILALDEGTTGATALVVAGDGRILAQASRPIPQHYPAPGLVEHEPHDLLVATVDAGREAIDRAGVAIDAIGLTNQRETVVAWDRETLAPIGRAIVWQDRRTAPRCEALRDAGHESEIRSRTGLLLDPYFSATKFEALLSSPAVSAARREKRLAFGTVDSWLIASLSGGRHVTDPTNASRTMLADLQRGEWDPWLLDLFGVPIETVATIVPSVGELATVEARWFGKVLPITGLAGDQQAALFGQGAERPGLAKLTYGTGAFLLRYDGAERPPLAADGVLATAAVSPEGGRGWALEGSTFIAGAAVSWLKESMGLISTPAETADLAASVTSTGGVMFVPAFTGLGAPYWNPEARGTIVGLTGGTTRAQLVRATLESIAHGSQDLLDLMDETTELRVDGGAAANDWLMQFQADLTGVPVIRPALVELTAYGAARLAALGLGRSLPPAEQLGASRRFEPRQDARWRADQRAAWRRAVHATFEWATNRIY